MFCEVGKLKEAFYTSHDSNARNDPKCAALRSKYKSEGYGWFWIIIELLRDQPNYKYPINKYTFDTFARELQCERNAAIEFVNDCCHEFADDKSALLCMDDNYLWSESLIRRMQGVEKRRESARNAANIKWSKESCGRNANAEQPQSGLNAVKDSKVKDSKIKDIYMTVQGLQITNPQYEKLISIYGKSAVDDKIEHAENYKDLKKKYVDLYKTLNNWLKKDIQQDKPRKEGVSAWGTQIRK
jgi:hypothetical protein